MADALLQTLTIKLNAEVGNTKRKLNDVATSVERLEEVGKKTDWSVFEQIRTNLEGIAKIDFSNVAEQLGNIMNAMKALGISAKNVKEMQAPKIASQTPTVEAVEPDFSIAETKVVNFTEALKEAGDVAKTTASQMSELGEAVGAVGDEAEKSAPKWQKLINSIKRITFYRMVRRAIQLISQAIRQGIENMALYDSEFNASVSEILSSITYLKNAIGASIAPLIKTLAPFITIILDGLAGIFNVLGGILAMLTGQKAFVKAKKEAEDFAESLRKVKNATLGIDELNILQKDNSITYFITVDVDDKKLDNFNDKLRGISTLASAIALIMTVDWASAITVFKGVLQTLFPTLTSLKVNIAGIGVALLGCVSTATSLVDVFKNGLNWSNFITLIIGCTTAIIGLNMAFHSLNITLSASIIGSLLLVATAIYDITQNGLNWQNGLLLLIGTIGTIIVAMKAMASTASILTASIAGIVSTLAVLVAGVVLFISLFNKIKEGWGQMNFWQKLASVIGLVLVAVGTLVATISAFLQQWHVFAIAVAGVAVGTALSIGAYKSAGDAPSFATGGFPEDGFFFANHTELVGQFSNGKTAVANNAQIIEGIKQGVLEAMTQANTEKDSIIKIDVDGREIAKVVKKYDREAGNAGFNGGFSYGI